jgi:hypothetical protein
MMINGRMSLAGMAVERAESISPEVLLKCGRVVLRVNEYDIDLIQLIEFLYGRGVTKEFPEIAEAMSATKTT